MNAPSILAQHWLGIAYELELISFDQAVDLYSRGQRQDNDAFVDLDVLYEVCAWHCDWRNPAEGPPLNLGYGEGDSLRAFLVLTRHDFLDHLCTFSSWDWNAGLSLDELTAFVGEAKAQIAALPPLDEDDTQEDMARDAEHYGAEFAEVRAEIANGWHVGWSATMPDRRVEWDEASRLLRLPVGARR